MSRSLPKYRDDLAGFAGILRNYLEFSQRKLANYFNLDHSTIARYENETIKPSMGYLACLVRLVLQKHQSTTTSQTPDAQSVLLQEINKAIRHNYPDEPDFQSWDELDRIADEYLAERQISARPIAGRESTAKNDQNAVSVYFDSAYFVEILGDWGDYFFRWSEAPEHMRSSWAGMVIYSLSAVVGRITPRGLFIVGVSLLLGVVSIQLTAPVFRWPLEEAAVRQVAYLEYGLATLLIPLLVAFVTPPDKANLFQLETARQKIIFWILKFTGALVGFWVFAMGLIGLALALYYLYVPPLPAVIRAGFAIVPLFFSYIVARRIPIDRYKMFDGELRLHPADRLFLVVFVVVGPLSAFFLYAFYGFFVDRSVAPVILLIVLTGVATWEYRKQNRRSL